jgi:hypothetical protein
VDLLVRPIFHRTEDHVRAHIFLCILAYYVEWHMREAWAPLLFQDEELSQQRKQRDPVAPAQSSPSARRKKSTRQSSEGLPLHSFKTLLAELARRCRNTCRVNTDPPSTFTTITDPTPRQARALQLLGL